jgi:hypothetical protein
VTSTVSTTEPLPIVAVAGTEVQRDPAQDRINSMRLTTLREADKSSTRKLIFVSGLVWQQFKQQHEAAAKPIGLEVELAGESMNLSLIDSGASRSIMRDKAYDRIKDKVKLKQVCNMYVLSATGHQLPIIGAVNVPFSHRGKLLGCAMVYVVDTSRGDIICDLVLGRPTIACSRYECIDCTGSGALRSKQHEDVIVCSPCRFDFDSSGVRQLVSESTPLLTQAVEDKNISPPVSRQQEKKERNKHKQQRLNANKRDKLRRITDIVTSAAYLSTTQQEQLLAYLVTTTPLYTVPTQEETNKWQEKRRTEALLLATAVQVQVVSRLHRLEQSLPGSEEEQQVTAELAAAVFVPPAVKDSPGQNRSSKAVEVEEAEDEEED